MFYTKFLTKIYCFVILSALCLTSNAVVLKNLYMSSKILNAEVDYSIYIPDRFVNSEIKLPVIYCLPGLSCTDEQFFDFSNLAQTLDEKIHKNTSFPLILVVPFSSDKIYYYMNSFDGQFMWEEMFVKEFVPYIETHYNVSNKYYERGIMGISMGGYGALLNSINNPEMFIACAAFSSGLRTDQQLIELSQPDYNHRYGLSLGKDLTNEKRITPHYKRKEIVNIIEKVEEKYLKKTKYLLHCGDDDIFINGNKILKDAMHKKGISTEFIEMRGKHDWNYWKTYLYDGIKFISEKISTSRKQR